MKKVITIVLFSVLLINLVGCAESQVQRNADNVENSNIQSSNTAPSETGSSMPQPNIDNSSEESKLISEAESEGQLPIVDEFIALDAVKLFLKLENYEKVSNGSGGYTYRKENFELIGNGSFETKETNEHFFLVSLICWDESMLADGIHKPATTKNYAVIKETGNIHAITDSDH